MDQQQPTTPGVPAPEPPRVLESLGRVAGVAAAYVVDESGVVEASAAGPVAQAQGQLLAALSAALRQATIDLDVGELGETILEAEGGAVLAGSLAGGRTVVVVTQPKANLGMIRLEVRKLRRSAQ